MTTSLQTTRAMNQVPSFARDLRAALGPPGPMQEMVVKNLGGALQTRVLPPAPPTLAAMDSYTIIYKMGKEDQPYPWIYVDLWRRDQEQGEEIAKEYIHDVPMMEGSKDDPDVKVEVMRPKVIESLTLQGTIQRNGRNHDISLAGYALSRMRRASDRLIYVRGATLRGRPSEIFLEEVMDELAMYGYLLPFSKQLSEPDAQRILNRIAA